MTGRARPRDRTPIAAGAPGTTAGAQRRRPISFGIHQLIEYLVAVGLVVLSVHVGHGGLLLGGGIVLGLLALTARGPFGLVRVCRPRLHAALDFAAGLLLAAAPLIGPLRPGAVGIVATEAAAVTWLRVTTLTRYTASPAPVAMTYDTVTAPAGTGRSDRDGGDAPAGPGPSAIRGLGQMTARARNRLPDARTTFESGARQLGTHAGRLQRAWRRASR